MVDVTEPCAVAATAHLVHLARREVTDLGPEVLVLGRGPEDVGVRLDGPRVSRRHVRLEPVAGGRHRLTDLGSTNGTYVNGRRVSTALLEPFDRLQVGDHVLLYLDPSVPAQRVVELLAPEETGRFAVDRSALAERILTLTLLVQERSGDAELMATVDAVLEELLVLTGEARAVLLVEQDVRGAPALRPIHARGAGAEMLSLGALGGYGALVDEALTTQQVARGSTPLGDACLCIPMESRSHAAHERRRRAHAADVRGGLLLAGGDGRWTPDAEEEDLLRALTRQIAVLLSNARLERQVTTDPLTQLPNRGYLERLLDEELRHLRATGEPVSVLLVDADDFKRVNDTRGHAVGDAVLRHLADRLRWAVRHTDSAGRWGGEEFLVILPGSDAAGAAVVADKLVHLIAASPEGSTGVRVTVSIGVAGAPEHALTASELVQRADEALYEAKRAGKNRHRVFAPAPAEAPRSGDTLRFPVPTLRADEPGPVAWLDADVLTIPLRPGVHSVGRSPDCGVVLPHREVSRQHGLLQVSAGGDRVVFEDCSRNGSSVNGVPVADAVELRPGDRLTIGPYTLRLRPEASDERLEKTSAGAMLGGSLADTCLCAFLLRLEGMRATGVLTVRTEGLVAELRLREGQVVAARAGDLLDLDAVARVLSLTGGAYVFCHAPVDDARRIPLTTSGVLLAACTPDPGGARACPRESRCVLETAKTARQLLDC